MAEFVPFDPDVHFDEFRQMYIEDWSGQMDELKERYSVDFVYISGMTVEEFVDARLDRYSGLRPPKGVFLILEVEGAVAGMVVLTKLSDTRGIISLMYNRPEYRGKGYAKQLILRLIEEGRKIGVTCFQLRTPVFSPAAQHIYRSAGFRELEEYPESLIPNIPLPFQPYWIYMEKKES